MEDVVDGRWMGIWTVRWKDMNGSSVNAGTRSVIGVVMPVKGQWIEAFPFNREWWMKRRRRMVMMDGQDDNHLIKECSHPEARRSKSWSENCGSEDIYIWE